MTDRAPDTTDFTLEMRAHGDPVGRALEGLREACAELEVGERDRAALELIVDELISNVSRHAYGGDDGRLELRVQLDAGRCVLTLVDWGPAFDPTRRRDPDVTASLEQREIGGLGIFLVRKKADSMEYRRREDRNELRVERRLGGGPDRLPPDTERVPGPGGGG